MQNHIWLLAIIIGATTALAMPTVSSTSETSLSTVTTLEVRDPEWDGTTGILLGSDTAAFMGVTVAALGGVIAGTCPQNSVWVNLMGNATCIAAIAAEILVAFTGFAAGIISATTKRDATDSVDWTYGENLSWVYPAIEGGLSMRDRILQAHDVDVNDGFPIAIGRSDCTEEWETCHTLWYSKSTGTDNRTIHHIHATPQSFDFRVNASTTTRVKRYDQTGVVTNNAGTTYYGGYTWWEANEPVLAAMVGEGASKFTTDILNQMNAENTATGKFAREGAYCMDFCLDTVRTPGSVGFLWYNQNVFGIGAALEVDLLADCGDLADQS